jgi:hypothetical protein
VHKDNGSQTGAHRKHLDAILLTADAKMMHCAVAENLHVHVLSSEFRESELSFPGGSSSIIFAKDKINIHTSTRLAQVDMSTAVTAIAHIEC